MCYFQIPETNLQRTGAGIDVCYTLVYFYFVITALSTFSAGPECIFMSQFNLKCSSVKTCFSLGKGPSFIYMWLCVFLFQKHAILSIVVYISFYLFRADLTAVQKCSSEYACHKNHSFINIYIYICKSPILTVGVVQCAARLQCSFMASINK